MPVKALCSNMKEFFTLSIIILMLGNVSKAQNMVDNPGFETITNCPTNWAQIAYSPGYVNFPSVESWVSPLETSTPDYFNACADISDKVNIPNTFVGYQEAHNGNGCAGIIAYYNQNSGGDYREYVQTKLNTTMIAGHSYKVSFYVSLNYDISNPDFNVIGIDRVGATFTQNQVSVTPDRFLMLDYSIVNDSASYINAKGAWVKIQGTYIAQGGEDWMTIGCMNNSQKPFTKVQVYPAVQTPGTEDYTYLFIDDVSVIDLDKIYTFTSAHDTLVCEVNNLVLTSPNIANSYLWNTGATTQSITINDSGTYWCKAKVGNNEYVDTFKLRRMHFYPNIFLGNDTLICSEDNYTLGGERSLATYYQWNTGATSCCILPNGSGTYYLTTGNGCDVRSDTINITSVACENCFWAPNAFTPNADGKNDRFGVVLKCLVNEATFSIFDRWGNMVFTTKDITEKWDGTYNGQQWPTDTYNFMVEYDLVANKPKQVFKGNFILIR